ncbi:MAG TPA: hypothetical protein VGD83_19250 [Streptosporangiaceae bacterium]
MAVQPKPVPNGRICLAAGQHRATRPRRWPLADSQSDTTGAGFGRKTVPSRSWASRPNGAPPENRSAPPKAQLAGLLSHVAAAIDRYRAGEIDACTVDETVHHYYRDAGELWKFCFSRGGGSHAEFVSASSTA